MTTAIRTWQDSDFYLSHAGTANVREQLIKLQSIGKLVRALSDASTVDTNGDKLQDRLLGLSLGDLTQRHKYRVLYDNLNDRFLVQRNSGTDASKTWVELLRIDSSGNVTFTGTLSTDSITTTDGGITLGGTLDFNGFYMRNADKYVGTLRTDSLIVHSTLTSGPATLRGVTLTGDLDANEFYIRNADDIQTETLRVGGPATFQNDHSIGCVYIASRTASASQTIDFTGLTHYPRYMIVLDQVRPVADNNILLASISTDNGGTFLSSTIYSSAGLANSNFPSQEQINTSGATAWQLLGDGGVNQDNASASAITGTVMLNSLGSGVSQARGRSQLEWVETTGTFAVMSDIGLFATPGAAVNGIRFQYLSGLIAGGTFRLYGLRSS